VCYFPLWTLATLNTAWRGGLDLGRDSSSLLRSSAGQFRQKAKPSSGLFPGAWKAIIRSMDVDIPKPRLCECCWRDDLWARISHDARLKGAFPGSAYDRQALLRKSARPYHKIWEWLVSSQTSRLCALDVSWLIPCSRNASGRCMIMPLESPAGNILTTANGN
jgi:hypothetical protein